MENISEITDRFMQFLAEAEKYGNVSESHVIFSSGTVVRVAADDTIEFAGFNENTYGEPDAELTNTIAQNNIVWDIQKNMFSGAAGIALRIAFNILITDECPNFYTDFDKIVSIPCETLESDNKILWSTVWITKSDKISNLSLENNYNVAQKSASNGRLFDYLFPSVYAVILPN